MTSPAVPGRRPSRRLWALVEIILVAAALYWLLPRVAGLQAIERTLRGGSWWVVPVAIVAETASLTSYAELERAALVGVGARCDRVSVYLITLYGAALGKVLPGGTTAALPFTTHMFESTGTEPELSVVALGGSGLLASMVLAAALIVAAVASLVLRTGDRFAAGVLVLAVVVLAAGFAARAVLNDPTRIGTLVERTANIVARGPLRRWINPDILGESARRGAAGFLSLAANRSAMRWATVWATASWLFDFVAFAVIAVTVGRGDPVGGLPLAYVVGQMAAAIPLTPGGVGVVETTMAAALVSQGVPAATATVAVLGWRIVSHWLPIVFGLVAYALRPRRLR